MRRWKASGGNGKQPDIEPVNIANAAFSKELPVMPKLALACSGLSDTPVEVRTSCYKCITDNAAIIKNDNKPQNDQKMRERKHAGNDSHMYSLTIGDNFDESGRFICNKPEGFVYLDMLGKKPWNLLAHFQLVGKMRDVFGNVVDCPDITPEQKIRQYMSAACIAQRNASLLAYETGSLNSAYAGMTGPVADVFQAQSPASSVSSFGADSGCSMNASDKDTPLTDYFSDIEELKDAADFGAAIKPAAY